MELGLPLSDTQVSFPFTCDRMSFPQRTKRGLTGTASSGGHVQPLPYRGPASKEPVRYSNQQIVFIFKGYSHTQVH